MRRIFGWAGLSVLLIAVSVIFQPSAVNAQVTTYPAANHSNMTALPLEDYPIQIPNTAILFAYDFTRKLAKDFVPFAQNLGFNVQVVGDIAGSSSWSLAVYTPGNANPVMEVSAKARISPLQGVSSHPLECAWGPTKTATILFFESNTPDALFPKDNNSGCGPGIFVQVSSQPGPDGAPPFSAFPGSPILQNAQDAVKYLNSQLSSIPGAPQLIFAPPPSPLCTTITIVPSSLDVLFHKAVMEEQNSRTTARDFDAGPSHGIIEVRNDQLGNPSFGADPLGVGPGLEHELLHALGIGHSGEATGNAFMFSSTDIMSLTGLPPASPNGGPASLYIPLTADEKQAIADLYGSASTVTVSASYRTKFCRLYNPTDPNAPTAITDGGTTGPSPPPPSTPPSCSMSCPFPQALDPDSCSCVCTLTPISCFPGYVDAQQCQCYNTTTRLLLCPIEITCPAGSFPDPSLNCQCAPAIGAQSTGGGGTSGGGAGGEEPGGCDPTGTLDGSPVSGTDCPL